MLKGCRKRDTPRAFTCLQESSGHRSTATTRAFRRQLNVSFADILADTLKFGSHCRARRKEDGSRSLGRSSDTVHYGAGNGREIEVEESRKSRGTQNRKRAFRIPGETPDFGRTRTSHCSLRVAISLDISVPEYMHTLRYGLPDIFNARNFHRVYRRSARLTGEIMFALSPAKKEAFDVEECNPLANRQFKYHLKWRKSRCMNVD